MTTIYLIRHAEAEGNLYRRIHGQYDSLVTARGWKQIEALAARFADTHIDAVYSSDLTRTRMTASAIYRTHGLPLRATPELREVAMGVWEDVPWGEIERAEPEQLHNFSYDPERWTTEGSEDIHALRARIKRAILAIAARHDGQTVAVVTHGCAIRAFMSEMRGVPPERIEEVPHCDNTAVALLHAEGGVVTVEYDGDNSHLPKELSTFSRQRWWEDVSARDCNNLRYRPFVPEVDMPLYVRYRQDDWQGTYGSMDGFDELIFDRMLLNGQRGEYSVCVAVCGDEDAGLLELDTARDAELGAGWIEFYYMDERFRGAGMSIQLIGQAVSVYRAAGRRFLRLAVPLENGHAAGFFRAAGFYDVGQESREGRARSVLEMKISLDFERADMVDL